MNDNQASNRRILKNTILLYLRMILIMGVTLYTTRVVLDALGVADFGIYNVVAGVIILASFLSSSMSSAIQRFMSFELGKNNLPQLRRVFAMSVTIHLILALIILIVSETLGLWFINTKLVIPVDRIAAANWVYQLSILAFLVNIVSVPYNAAILAYEKMNIFAYIGIVEALLKLLAAFALLWFSIDRLFLYAILIFLISLIVRVLYGIYVNKNIKDCKYSLFWDGKLFKKLVDFAGWNLWGNIAFVSYNQGINILLNIFFGPTVNAARAVAYQVNGALNSFVANFQVALKPQIIKSYAIGDTDYMRSLMFSGAKYSFFLMMLICAPFILSTPQILNWWLGNVPEYTTVFCRLVLVESLINSISGTLMTGAQASGKIKLYQGVVGGLLLFILPVSYVFLYLGYSPQTTFFVSICISIMALFARLLIVSSILLFSMTDFFKKALFPSAINTLIVFIVGRGLYEFSEKSFINLFFANIVLVISTLISILFIGLNKEEIAFLKEKLKEIKWLDFLKRDNSS